MGGDLPPSELVRGGVDAGRRTDLSIAFVGDPAAIRDALDDYGEREGDRFSVLPAREIIGMDEPPVRAVRSKRDSSLVRGLEALSRGDAEAFVSSGNTGAVVAGSIFTLGRLPGIPRPGIAATLPSVEGREFLVIDVGACVDCTPDHIAHFALMGASYAQAVLEIDSPRIGLLNVGTEKAKGDKLSHRTHEILASGPLPFVGNVEGHHLLTERPVDVVVCDGFTGNIFLKAVEGGVAGVTSLLRRLIKRSLRAKLGSLFLRPVFSALRERLSYQRHGGAPLLGVNGTVLIAHGRSDAAAIAGAIEIARRVVATGLNRRLAEGLQGWARRGR